MKSRGDFFFQNRCIFVMASNSFRVALSGPGATFFRENLQGCFECLEQKSPFVALILH
jgi:hypothetical protein